MNYYIHVLKNYALFTGRARRQEYWMFVLINVIISIVIGVVAAMIKLPILGISIPWPSSCPRSPWVSAACTTPTTAAGGSSCPS